MGTVHELFPKEQPSSPTGADALQQSIDESVQRYETKDRQPLVVKEGADGIRWLGIEGPDGELAPLEGVRGKKAYRPLGMKDRLVCWDSRTDCYEIVRVGAMTYDDLLGAAHYIEYQGSASLLGQAVSWLWWRINHPLYGNDNSGTTVESILDEEGHNALDYNWRTAL